MVFLAMATPKLTLTPTAPMAAATAAAPALAVMCEPSSAETSTLAATIVALSPADAPVTDASVSTPIRFSV